MRGNELLDKMELADPAYVEAADRKLLRKRRGWIAWAAAAACLCLLIAAIPVFSQKPSTPQEGTTDYGGPPRVAVNGRTYVISPYLANAEELPDGFTYAGTTDVDNGFEDCAYYTNPDIPEWIYVYQEVRTDGTVDETGTLVSTPPHNAYTRYVDERLRGKKLVCFDGNYYISMWSAWYSGEDPDVIEAYYEKIYEQYGIQIEGAVPDEQRGIPTKFQYHQQDKEHTPPVLLPCATSLPPTENQSRRATDGYEREKPQKGHEPDRRNKIRDSERQHNAVRVTAHASDNDIRDCAQASADNRERQTRLSDFRAHPSQC